MPGVAESTTVCLAAAVPAAAAWPTASAELFRRITLALGVAPSTSFSSLLTCHRA